MAALVLVAWSLLGAIGSPPAAAHVCAPDPTLPTGGALVVPSGAGVAVVDLEDRGVRPVPLLPAVGVVSHVARSSADGRLALARFSRPAGDQVGGSDILVTGPEGGAPSMTVARERPGEVLGAPSWLPDGGLVFERLSVTGAGDGARVERVNPDGSDRRVVVERGAAPTVSPDGTALAFVRSEVTDRLVLRPLDGGPEQTLVDHPGLLAIAFPRFSPDGRWVAFSAVGEGAASLPADGPAGLSSLRFGPPVALAHGLPWDVWLVRRDGGELRRLTAFYDDEPAPAWSADGRWLAVFAAESVKLVSTEDGSFACVLGTGGYGGFDWIRG